MCRALADAGLDRVDYVQAHGTSTPLNDAAESQAIARLMNPPWLSSAKGALGHWIAGAGALGSLCAIESLRSGVLFPSAGLEQPDPECPGQHIMGASLERTIQSAMVNAFAFGGANCSLIFECRP